MQLSAERQIPLIPIHHMEAHALVSRLTNDVTFPFLCLLVSGGHNLLLVVHGIGNYTQIGTTLDDSLGRNDAFLRVHSGRETVLFRGSLRQSGQDVGFGVVAVRRGSTGESS